MAFDECPPYPADYNYVSKSMHLTHRWLERCISKFNKTDMLYGEEQVLAPIVQGGTYSDLRKESAKFIADKNLEINAIGGLSVGEPKEMMYEHTQDVCEILPENKPRYLMGVGTPENILDCISYGIDMFDCVLPTRNARHGLLYTTEGIINIKNAKWKNDFSKIDPGLENEYSEYYNKSYLRHLIHSKEMLGFTIASAQNLSFYFWLIKQSREKIREGIFSVWKKDILEKIMRRL
jgi:queuine tRNA-ribosyltransferase